MQLPTECPMCTRTPWTMCNCLTRHSHRMIWFPNGGMTVWNRKSFGAFSGALGKTRCSYSSKIHGPKLIWGVLVVSQQPQTKITSFIHSEFSLWLGNVSCFSFKICTCFCMLVCAKMYMHCTHTAAHSMILSSTPDCLAQVIGKRLTEFAVRLTEIAHC